MRRVNLSMLMLLCLTCGALFSLVAAQQNLIAAEVTTGDDEDGGVETTRRSYFVTVTPSSTLEVFSTATPTATPTATLDDGNRLIYADELEGVELLPRVEAVDTATPTRTPTPINVGNFVWDDLDQDGKQDAGEPGLPNVTVQIWTGDKTQLLDSDVTDANGIYQLTVAGPGQYRVRVVLPAFNDQFSPKDQAGGNDAQDSDINPSGTNIGFTDIYVFSSSLISITSIDAGIIKYRTPTPTRTPTPVNFGNFVWDDLDQDGQQDPGEPGLAGVTVQLWNDAKSQLLDTDVTTINGIYSLQSPGPGDYRVRVVLPAFNDQFSPKDQAGGNDSQDSDINPSGTNIGFTDIISVASNVISITSIDAGIIKFRTPTPTRTPTPINVGNFVWNDLDGDGYQDAGEPGIEGVTVQLWDSTKTTLFDEAVTDASGIYLLVAPTPGNYRVRVIKPSSADDFSPKDAVADDAKDSDVNPSGTDAGFTDTYVFASNLISITSIDIGMIPATPINLGNFVWEDTNGDGIQGSHELGIAGRTVRLRRHFLGFDITVATTVTNASGVYTLVAPDEGTYFICVTTFSDEVISPKDVFDGTLLSDQHDSDINPTATGNGLGCTDDFTATAGATITNVSHDAGLSTPRASLVGQVALQGHGTAPDIRWIVPVRVRIVPQGGGAAVVDKYVTTDTNGKFIVGAIPVGDYEIWVKHDHTLAVLLIVHLDAGNNNLNFGTLLEGDASNDNAVTISDFSILAAAFGKTEGQAGYDSRADFTNDAAVTINDFALLAANFGQPGEPMP